MAANTVGPNEHLENPTTGIGARLSERIGRTVRPAWLVLGLATTLTAGLWICLAIYLGFERDSALQSGQRQADNYARLLEEHTVRTVRVLDQATIFVKTEFERLGPGMDLAAFARRGVFLDQFFNLISVAGPDGVIIAADRDVPRSNISDRPHFQVHVAQDSGQVFISKPVLGRSSGKWSLQFTRRINRADGSFGGVVIASLDPAYFTRFYQSLDLGPASVAALVGSDGVVKARRSGELVSVGQELANSTLLRKMSVASAGSYTADSRIDGVRRLYSYRRLADYPLAVVVGFAEREIYAEYEEHKGLLQVIGLFATTLILSSALVALGLVSYQKKVQRSLRDSERAAQSASRLKSEFIARMSHELRTPLNGILGFSEYLQENAENAENREFAATIHQAGLHLLNLVNTTLDLAKIEAGRMELALNPVELEPLVRGVTAVHRAFAEGKGLQLVTVLGPGLPARIRCDATKLVQVLNNLVHNAIKFTECGSVSVEVRADEGRIAFAVSDTGPGIPEDQQACLFERFRQLDTAFVTRSHEGSGLGLALAKDLVELMGGTIRVESHPGHGSRFRFSLSLESA